MWLVEERSGAEVVTPLRDCYDGVMRHNQGDIVADAPRLLRIRAPTVQVKFPEMSWDRIKDDSSEKANLEGVQVADGLYAVLDIRQGVTTVVLAYLDGELQLDGSALGLVLSSSDAANQSSHAILLLAPDGPHFGRVGLIRVVSGPSSYSTGPEKSPQMVHLGGYDRLLSADKVQLGERPVWLREAVMRTVALV
jgi:hypothetical protein